MKLSMEDFFSKDKQVTNLGSGDTTKATYSDGLDFLKHGDDLLNKLKVVVRCSGTMTSATSKPAGLAIYWQTDADAAFGSATETLLTPASLADAAVVEGKFLVKNAPLPRGLERYNRLKYVLTTAAADSVMTTAPKLDAFITDNVVEPLA